MKVLITSDWHLDISPKSGVDRWPDLERKVEEIADVVQREKPDGVVHLGDVTDPDSGHRTVRALSMLLYFWRRCLPYVGEIGCHQLAGNHDVIDLSDFESTVSLASHGGVSVHSVPRALTWGGKPTEWLLMLPYLSAAHAPVTIEGKSQSAQEWLETMVQSELARITKETHDWNPIIDPEIWVFCHLDVDGALVGSESRMLRGGKLVLPRSLEENPNVQLIVGGHIHKPQRIRDKVIIVGSPERLDFGEAGEPKGYVILEVER